MLEDHPADAEVLLDSTGEGIYSVDATGQCTFINRAGARTVGWSQRDVIGKMMHELIHHTHPDGSTYDVAQCPICRAYETGTACRVDEEVFWRQDGTSFPVGYSAYPVIDDGRVAGAVVTFADVTERRKLEAQTVLERAGYTVRAAASAADALAVEPDAHIDLLITDLVLPGMNGTQLAAALTGRWPALRVLCMSGYTGTALPDHPGEPGAAFLGKPFTPAAFARKVREVLDAG